MSQCRSRSTDTRRPLWEVLREDVLDDSTCDEGHARFSGGRTTGARSRSATTRTSSANPPKSFKGPAEAGVQGQGRPQRQSAPVGLGHCGRLRGRAGERRLRAGRRGGNRMVVAAEEGRQLHPDPDDSADGCLGPDPHLDRLGLQQPCVHQGVFRRRGGRSTSRRTASTAATTWQAINATAPHPWAARLWQEFLFSDQGQILWLKGFAHPARFNDLAKRNKIPKSLLSALPPAALYAKAKFASVAQQTAAKNKIVAEWPSKVGA